MPLLDIPFALGFMTHSPLSPLLNGRSFGHYGAGGSLGFADPDRPRNGARELMQSLKRAGLTPHEARLWAALFKDPSGGRGA